MEEANVPPITIMAGRAIIAFVCLLLVALITKKDLIEHFKHIGKFLVFAILGIVVLWLGLAFGQEYVTAGIGSVMVTITPLLTYIIIVLILKEEKFSISGLVGLLVGVAGIVLVVGVENIIQGGATLKGVLLIGGGFMFFAINGVLVGKWAKHIDPVITSTYYLLIAGIILTALAFIIESPETVPWTVDNYLEELAIGVICTASGYFGYYYLIHKAGAFFSSLIFYFIPIFGMLAGFLLLHEKVLISQVIGVALIIAGVYLVNRAKLIKGK
jgi:drug/metabolite transporter (DMT)-like permease